MVRQHVMRQQVASKAPRGARESVNSLSELVTMRMMGFFVVLRRYGVLASQRQFHLSEVEWRIMTHVGRHAPLTLNRLSGLTLQDRGHLSRAVKSMVQRGLLTRERKPGLPEVEIEFSESGLEVYAAMVERAVERDQRLTRKIPPEDREALRRVIDLMRVEIDEMLDEERQLTTRAGPTKDPTT